MQNRSEQQRVALVTGGAKRVGRAIVQMLARNGFGVLFTYHSSELDAKSIETEFAGTHGVKADWTDPANSMASVTRTFGEIFSRLDLIVHSASIYQAPKSLSEELTALRKMNSVHIETPIMLCDHFGQMLRKSRGHIVTMLDILAERPWPEYRAYCASKAALWNLTLSLARQFAPEVTVNGIAPGVVEWPAGYPEEQKAAYLKRVPLNRPGTPEDVANLVHYLCTTGSYLTGQIIRLDGGRSIT